MESGNDVAGVTDRRRGWIRCVPASYKRICRPVLTLKIVSLSVGLLWPTFTSVTSDWDGHWVSGRNEGMVKRGLPLSRLTRQAIHDVGRDGTAKKKPTSTVVYLPRENVIVISLLLYIQYCTASYKRTV